VEGDLLKHNIVIYGHPALRRKSVKVKTVDDDTRRFADDLLETMYAYGGIGLAAAQIDHTECMCVIDMSQAGDRPDARLEENDHVAMPMVLINPTITAMEGKQVGQEGCLSFPEIYADVRRADLVTVSYQNLDNQKVVVKATGLLSRALQHEIDHLNGVLFVDRIAPAQKVVLSGKLKRLKKTS